ncbi:hypothetical protein A2V82_04365 [candidate division KSB1 bacterium RBG_16_48_16]|nr:MAG: hypothetical protein A2V82_04365 [candidate division KSB1 bacterium RBG_16_48_16]
MKRYHRFSRRSNRAIQLFNVPLFIKIFPEKFLIGAIGKSIYEWTDLVYLCIGWIGQFFKKK